MIVMNLEYLLGNAARFAYEYSKFFNEEEKLIKYFKTEEYVVILSTKKLCIFYMGIIIDFKQEFLKNTTLENINEDTFCFNVKLENKEFDVRFLSKQEFSLFLHYYEKYKK